jgi:hypothetical protein
MSTDPCACQCEYPVDVKRARRAFSRAVRELEKVRDAYGDAFKQYEAQQTELWDREYTNRVRKIGRSVFRQFHTDWTLNSVRWNRLLVQMKDLKDISDRVLSWTLPGACILLMRDAEKLNYLAVAAAELAALPPIVLPDLVPKSPEPPEPWSWVKVPARKGPSIWDSIFGTGGV